MAEHLVNPEILEGMTQQFGMRFEEIGNGYVRVVVPLKPEHLNFHGIPYGGWLFHIADLTAGIAFLSDGKTEGVTASGDIQYLRAAMGAAKLTCIARVVKRGHMLDYVETELLGDEGKMLARANFMFARTD